MIVKTKKSDLAEFVVEAKRLRSAVADSMTEFFYFLQEAEGNTELWRGDSAIGTGYTTFEEMLKAEGLVSVSVYARYKRTVAELGQEHVREVGFEAAAAILPIPEDAPSAVTPALSARKAALAEVEVWKVKNGTTPTKRLARACVRKHYASAKRTPPTTGDQAEIKALRAQVKTLKAEKAILEKALAEAQKQLAALRAGAATPKARGSLAKEKSRPDMRT